MSKIVYLIIVILLIITIVLTICGCNNSLQHSYYQDKLQNKLNQDKLNNIILMDNQIGAIIGYNLQILNSPYIIGDIQSNRIDWMQWHVINSKLGKYYE